MVLDELKFLLDFGGEPEGLWDFPMVPLFHGEYTPDGTVATDGDMIEGAKNLVLECFHKRINVNSQKEPHSLFKVVEGIAKGEILGLLLALSAGEVDPPLGVADVGDAELHGPVAADGDEQVQDEVFLMQR